MYSRPHTAKPPHPGGLVSDEADGLHSGTPSLELGHPVGEGGLGSQDQVGTLHVSHVDPVA